MSRHGIRERLSDVVCIFCQRCRLIVKDRVTMGVLVISIVVFVWMLHTLSSVSKEQSALPIGVVDNDQSSSSRRLIKRLKEVSTLRIIEKKEKALQERLLDEMIMALFVIDDGYEEKLQSGNVTECISMYYTQDNKAASILSDVVAGEMMYDVCYYKALRLYGQIPFYGQKHTTDQFKCYMDQLLAESKEFDFAFAVSYAGSGRASVKEEQVGNEILYQQLIIGILGILIAWIAMFILSGTVRDKETGVEERLKTAGITCGSQDIGNGMALMVMEAIVAFIFTIMLMLHLQIEDFGLWASAYLLLMLEILLLGSIFLLISKCIKRMMTYQVICSVWILVTGGLGFWGLLTGFQTGFMKHLVKIIPNSWFILSFTDIIIYGREGGYIKEGHRVLCTMAAAAVLLNLMFHWMRKLPLKRK